MSNYTFKRANAGMLGLSGLSGEKYYEDKALQVNEAFKKLDAPFFIVCTYPRDPKHVKPPTIGFRKHASTDCLTEYPNITYVGETTVEKWMKRNFNGSLNKLIDEPKTYFNQLVKVVKEKKVKTPIQKAVIEKAKVEKIPVQNAVKEPKGTIPTGTKGKAIIELSGKYVSVEENVKIDKKGFISHKPVKPLNMDMDKHIAKYELKPNKSYYITIHNMGATYPTEFYDVYVTRENKIIEIPNELVYRFFHDNPNHGLNFQKEIEGLPEFNQKANRETPEYESDKNKYGSTYTEGERASVDSLFNTIKKWYQGGGKDEYPANTITKFYKELHAFLNKVNGYDPLYKEYDDMNSQVQRWDEAYLRKQAGPEYEPKPKVQKDNFIDSHVHVVSMPSHSEPKSKEMTMDGKATDLMNKIAAKYS